MQAQFEIGQKVHFIGDSKDEAGEVLSYSYSADKGFVYQISAREVDLAKKEVINGVKTCTEAELVAVEEGEE